MNAEEFMGKLCEFISNKFEGAEIDGDTKLMELAGSSLEFIDLICEVEEDFDVEIDLLKIPDITQLSIKDITNLI